MPVRTQVRTCLPYQGRSTVATALCRLGIQRSFGPPRGFSTTRFFHYTVLWVHEQGPPGLHLHNFKRPLSAALRPTQGRHKAALRLPLPPKNPRVPVGAMMTETIAAIGLILAAGAFFLAMRGKSSSRPADTKRKVQRSRQRRNQAREAGSSEDDESSGGRASPGNEAVSRWSDSL